MRKEITFADGIEPGSNSIERRMHMGSGCTCTSSVNYDDDDVRRIIECELGGLMKTALTLVLLHLLGRLHSGIYLHL